MGAIIKPELHFSHNTRMHAGTANSLWANLPLSIALVIVLKPRILQLSGMGKGAPSTRPPQPESESKNTASSRGSNRPPFSKQPPLTEEQRDAWQRQVGSKVRRGYALDGLLNHSFIHVQVVEYAWDKLCGTLIQQVRGGDESPRRCSGGFRMGAGAKVVSMLPSDHLPLLSGFTTLGMPR